MSILSDEQRVRVLAALLDGNSERAVERMADVNRRTIRRFVLRLGAGAGRLHDCLVRDLRASFIQCDEIWSFIGKKEARVTAADPPGIGEAYTFVVIDANSRLLIAWRVGRRDQETCDAFMADVRARLLVMPQMTSDGFAPYITSVGANFGPGIDYMMTVKNYRTGAQCGPDHRYEPPRDPFITKSTIYGAPDPKKASTSYVERLNGTTRTLLGRMRRLVYAFSKRPENHRSAVALHYVGYNLCWVVKTLRVTLAMQAGITDHVWSTEELLGVLLSEPVGDAPEAKSLEHREPDAPARKLPSGRGWLRLVTEPTPALRRAPVIPEPPPGASPLAVVPPPVEDRQLDLFSWKPRAIAPAPVTPA